MTAECLLHKCKKIHSWPFSAIAELIGNSADHSVNAKQLWIDVAEIQKQLCLTFTDNGCGMTPLKLQRMLSFKSTDPLSKQSGNIGYGLESGFKSGSLRLGKDIIVFTKNGGALSTGLLSITYLEQSGMKTFATPVVTFSQQSKKLIETEHSARCLDAILLHSLFDTEEAILSEFDAIPGKKGTRIIIWNIQRKNNGDPELDFETDEYDIRIGRFNRRKEDSPGKLQFTHVVRLDTAGQESNCSLRAYCTVLYLKPRMQIYLRQRRVRTCLITKSLANVKCDVYKPSFTNKRVKVVFGINCENKEQFGIMMYHNNRLIKAYEKVGCQLRDASGLDVSPEWDCSPDPDAPSKEVVPYHTVVRKADKKSKRIDQSAKKVFSSAIIALKSSNATCLMGRYIHALMDSSKQLLLKLSDDDRKNFQEVLDDTQAAVHQTTTPVGGVGVIGVIECNFLKPRNNKLDFESNNDYRLTIAAVGQKLNTYCKEQSLYKNSQETGADTLEVPDQTWVQCDECLKWRKLPGRLDRYSLPEKWFCDLHPRPKYRSCSVPEKKELYEEELTPTKEKQPKEQNHSASTERMKSSEKGKSQVFFSTSCSGTEGNSQNGLELIFPSPEHSTPTSHLSNGPVVCSSTQTGSKQSPDRKYMKLSDSEESQDSSSMVTAFESLSSKELHNEAEDKSCGTPEETQSSPEHTDPAPSPSPPVENPDTQFPKSGSVKDSSTQTPSKHKLVMEEDNECKRPRSLSKNPPSHTDTPDRLNSPSIVKFLQEDICRREDKDGISIAHGGSTSSGLPGSPQSSLFEDCHIGENSMSPNQPERKSNISPSPREQEQEKLIVQYEIWPHLDLQPTLTNGSISTERSLKRYKKQGPDAAIPNVNLVNVFVFGKHVSGHGDRDKWITGFHGEKKGFCMECGGVQELSTAENVEQYQTQLSASIKMLANISEEKDAFQKKTEHLEKEKCRLEAERPNTQLIPVTLGYQESDGLYWSKKHMAYRQAEIEKLASELKRVIEEKLQLEEKLSQVEKQLEALRETHLMCISPDRGDVKRRWRRCWEMGQQDSTFEKLKSLRMNVIRLLTTLLPHLNMELVFCDLEQLDDLLQDVLQTNKIVE
ncbi:MORC family CW-type zinc finger protein 4 [Lissotriton helveticus]